MNKIAMGLVAGFTLLVGVLVFSMGKNPNAKDIPLTDMPAFEGKSYFNQDKVVSNKTLEKGYVLVNFWQTNCASCMAEHPELMELKDKVKIVGIAWFEKGERVKKKFEKLDNPFSDVLIDGRGQVGTRFGISGTPTSFLFKDGKQIWDTIGDIDENELKDEILPLLEGKGGSGG